MSISGHLKDLRKRVLWSLLGILAGAVGGWFLYGPVMDYITAPLLDIQDANTQINFPTIGAALDLKLRVSLWVGVIISCPWWIYQVGAFIVPGLKRKERWYAFAFGAAGVLLFLGGALTGVMLVPRAVEILQSFVPVGGSSLLQADAYVDFYTRLVILFGISFLIPEVLVALNFLGVLSARNMLRAWRWAVLVAFIFAAIANPLPSPWPMIVQALILLALYLVAVLISWINERYRQYGWRLRSRKKDDDGAGAGATGPGSHPGLGGQGGPSPVPGAYPVPGEQGGPNAFRAVSPTPQTPMTPPTPQVPQVVMFPPSGPVGEPFAAVMNGPVPQVVTPPAPHPVSQPVPQPMPQPVSQPMPQQMPQPVSQPIPQPTSTGAPQLCGVVILAGGTAKRMGGVSKPDVVVGGKTLLVRAIEEVRAVAPTADIVVVAPPKVAIPQGVSRVLEDPPFGGPVAGVAAGFEKLTTLPGYRPGGLVGLLTCDAPLAPRLYSALGQAYREATVQSLRDANAEESGQPAQFIGGAVPVIREEAPREVPSAGVERTAAHETAKPGTYSQYLHGVYVAGALAQLFATQVRDRSVRSLFKQLRLATVTDAERVGMDVDTWEDAAALERRLAELK